MRCNVALLILGLAAVACTDPVGPPAIPGPPTLRNAVVFISDRDGSFKLYSMDLGSGAVTLIPLPTSGFPSGPVVSRDGRRIAFATNGIWVMKADGSDPVKVNPSFPSDQSPAWAPDGTRIAFQSPRDGNREIYVMDVTGANQTRLTDDPATDGFPLWSPDGTQIAFTSDRAGNNDVWIMNIDGSNQVQLTTDPEADIAFSWSHDATKLAFISNRTFPPFSQLFIMDRDGGNQIQVVTPFRVSAADWLPGDSLFVLESNADLVTVRRDGTDPINLTMGPASDASPRASP